MTMKYHLFDIDNGSVSRLWMPTTHGLDNPTDAYVQGLRALRKNGLYVLEPGQLAGGGAFTGGGGGGSSSDTFVMNMMSSQFSPSASTTYAVSPSGSWAGSGGIDWYHILVPIACTAAVVYYSVFVAGTNPSSANVTHKVRKNDTTSTTGATIDWNGATTALKNATESPALSFSAGDRWGYLITTPAWGTAPTSATAGAAIKFTVP